MIERPRTQADVRPCAWRDRELSRGVWPSVARGKREVLMSRTIVVGLSALFIAASTVAYAQPHPTAGSPPQPTAGSPPATGTAEAQATERLSDADFKAITDR